MFLQCFALPLKVITILTFHTIFQWMVKKSEHLSTDDSVTGFASDCLKPKMMKKLLQAYGHYFDLTIVNNDIDETIR